MKQILKKEICLKCLGCCRFLEPHSSWAPGLLDKEIKVLSKYKKTCLNISPDKKIIPLASKEKDCFFCPFLHPQNNKCKIYSKRPFECRLYPFLINSKEGKTYLTLDLNCPFVAENKETAAFKKYTLDLARLLNKESYKKLLRDNPQVIQSYPQAVNVAQIEV